MNPIQRIIKALSDVFIDIMPGILAAALLTGLSGVLANVDLVQNSETLFGITKLINISPSAFPISPDISVVSFRPLYTPLSLRIHIRSCYCQYTIL